METDDTRGEILYSCEYTKQHDAFPSLFHTPVYNSLFDITTIQTLRILCSKTHEWEMPKKVSKALASWRTNTHTFVFNVDRFIIYMVLNSSMSCCNFMVRSGGGGGGETNQTNDYLVPANSSTRCRNSVFFLRFFPLRGNICKMQVLASKYVHEKCVFQSILSCGSPFSTTYILL